MVSNVNKLLEIALEISMRSAKFEKASHWCAFLNLAKSLRDCYTCNLYVLSPSYECITFQNVRSKWLI